MPNQNQHQNKAKNNRQFLDTIDCNVRPDWAAVVAFYTAVHLVEALRALDGQDSQNHQDRLQYVQTNHRAIHSEFHGLLNASKLARYEANAVFHKQFANTEVKSILIDQWLVAIEHYVEKYIADRTRPPQPSKPPSPQKK